MNINNDQQYQTARKEYLTLKGRGNLSGQDQQKFNELQAACGQWESSPNFHGDRVTGIDSARGGGDKGVKDSTIRT